MKNQIITKHKTDPNAEFRELVYRQTAEAKTVFDGLGEAEQRRRIQLLDEQYLRCLADNSEEVVTNFIFDFKELLMRGVKWN